MQLISSLFLKLYYKFLHIRFPKYFSSHLQCKRSCYNTRHTSHESANIFLFLLKSLWNSSVIVLLLVFPQFRIVSQMMFNNPPLLDHSEAGSRYISSSKFIHKLNVVLWCWPLFCLRTIFCIFSANCCCIITVF